MAAISITVVSIAGPCLAIHGNHCAVVAVPEQDEMRRASSIIPGIIVRPLVSITV